MILGALGYSYSISTVASSFGHTAYGKQAFRDRLHNMKFYLTVRMCVQYIYKYMCTLICMSGRCDCCFKLLNGIYL